MNLIVTQRFPDFSRRLLDRLRPMVAGKLEPGMNAYAEQLFIYCCFDREKVKALELDCPMVCIVLHGQKEVWLGDRTQVFPAGSVFVLPGGVPMDVVNIPDETNGLYVALRLDVPSLPEGIAPLSATERMEGGEAGSFGLPLSEDLVEALCHAATTIADGTIGETIKRLRMTEVLALLRPLPEARMLFRQSLSEEIAWLIATAPSEPWSVADVAEQLGIGASTLRRRLSLEGASFRAILRRERLKAGQNAISSGASSIAAAEAAGYASRSHFSRRFRETFGTSPTGRR
ncbi:helix-turn-helix domain-containing protein [Neorhizobium galegae]|uniref:helix-turn-helix domain-containing protein n=1 Tax=Neorhizobium galegae TaxID=399 RepID=UPI00062223C7|nr:helix-turn-helix domain-containing protein [Neorhizobium galegae]CDZ25202.1 AraC protein [Neorhizobium galegae bv. officinalis]KAA9387922.1 AraC family transcriptional regulator [Neorhizobium galegae]KAB1115607.1 AraC family transcriptional regulator [Neorhizobium galegae]MCM2501610.1 AraC family transcriptional regulator [Neorhizobium galegae]MCQ1765849.1 AraC family transcriptional regulator [Neorhizobium galegae]